MYGVIALFDERTEQMIKDIWRELSEKSISFYAEEVEDRSPHITLASYKDLNCIEYIKQLDVFYENKSEIDITFKTIGTFLNSGALFFSPIVTKELLEFHSQHHKHILKGSMTTQIHCTCQTNGSLIVHWQIGYQLKIYQQLLITV
jgi:2'-5' RNA ligase